MKLQLLATLVLLPALGCGPTLVLPADDGDGSSAGDSSGPPATAATTTPTAPLPETSTTTASTTTATTVGIDTGEESTSVGFISDDFGCVVGEEDWWHCTYYECDMFAQDCPRGEKCMPWANDGGTSWNASRCSPVFDDATGPGEPCTVEGSAYSGIDSCALGSMCWGVDPSTLLGGTCVQQCAGEEANPQCDQSSSCLIAYDGYIILCLPDCDPLLGDCDAGDVCIPADSAFVCTPALPGAGAGEPCDTIDGCSPGLVCLDSTIVGPPCDQARLGCCAPWCDLSAPDPTAPCLDPGQACESWWAGGDPPPMGLEALGVCVMPQG